MASEPEPAIDLAHLAQYTQGDKALELELLTMFLPSAQGYIDAMAASEGGTDDESWSRGAHSLKGIALGVGAKELAELALQAEEHRDDSAAIRGGDVAALRAALERVRCFVADLN